MFTLAKIKDGGTYLERHLAANDYYCENETVVGKWIGEGARRLGLDQDIHAGDKTFESLRNNRVPDSTEKLTPRDSPNRVKFFDFQCSAQKSVSVMAVTLGDTRLLQAHDAAAKLAFSEMEKFASRQANTALTRINIPTGNVIAASFRHTASRALDPQVHTHFVTANATWDEKIRSWRALNEFEMFMAIRYAGKVYQNEMARSCRALGYEISESRDGRGAVTGFEIRGVSPEVCRRFSKRRAQVELGIAKFIESHGREPTNGEIHAIAVSSRDRKLSEITTPAVLAAQRDQLSLDELRTLTGLRDEAIARSREPGHNLGLGKEQESLRFAAAHLFERRSVVRGHELLAEALNQNLGLQELSRLQAIAQESELVRLSGKEWLRELFATKKGLELEKWAVDFVNESRCKFEPLGDKNAKLSPHLSPEQRKAAKEVLGSIDQVTSLRGAAGVGKTTVLAEIWREIELAGSQVFACAPTSAAADTMRKEGLPATTLAEFLENVAFRERDRLKDAVLIVDEGGLTSNRQGAELLRLSEKYSARVLFLGDSRQHSSVEAGDFLRVLETHSHIRRVELDAIRRQEHQAYREAVGCLATGAARLGLEKLDALGWVKEGFSNYIGAAASDYARMTRNGKAEVLAVTPTWAEQEAFTRELRAKLKAAGRLGKETTVSVHEPLKWTRAQTRNPANYQPGMVAVFGRSSSGFRAGEFAPVTRVARGRVFVQTPAGEQQLPLRSRSFGVCRPRPLGVAAGDRILVRANDRHARLLNGEIVPVIGVESGVLHLADGRAIDTARFRDFTHGYAVTSHASQSKTVDHVIVAAERLDAKAAYVACSRGRHTCTVHTPDKAALLDRLPSGNREAALDMLNVEHAQKKDLTHNRWGFWTKAQEHFHSLEKTVSHAWDIGAARFREIALRASRGDLQLVVDTPRRERDRPIEIER
jgi:conjugative relaxase-like TrwC/TraI family protein